MIVLIVNVIAGALLIPRYGLPGAIASMAISQVCDTAANWFYAFRRVQVRLPIAPMWRQALAAVLAGAVAYAITQVLHLQLAFVCGAAAFLLIYLPLCVSLRTLRASEFEAIAHVVGRLGPGGRRLATRIVGLSRFAMLD